MREARPSRDNRSSIGSSGPYSGGVPHLASRDARVLSRDGRCRKGHGLRAPVVQVYAVRAEVPADKGPRDVRRVVIALAVHRESLADDQGVGRVPAIRGVEVVDDVGLPAIPDPASVASPASSRPGCFACPESYRRPGPSPQNRRT